VSACAVFEDRLIDYDELSPKERVEVDEHLQSCSGCRDYLALLRDIDAALSAQVQRVHLDPQRVVEIRQSGRTAAPIGRVTRLPEWLDFVAAGAVLAVAGGLAWQVGLVALVVNALRVL